MGEKPNAYQKLFAELKRRRVFNSAAVYGGVAFVVIQSADFMIPALQLPEVVSTVIALVAIIGFPVSMVLAWTFDVTSSGVRVTKPSSATELEAIVAQPAIRRWPVGIAATAGIALLLGGVWFELGGRFSSRTSVSGSPAPIINSVAVLPFLHLDDGSPQEYLGEGIANELLEALSRIPGLQVTARTSAFSFQGAQSDLDSISHNLHVAFLLEGSVERKDEEVQIALRLVAAGESEPVWTLTRPLPEEDFLEALDDVAWSVAEALGAPVPDSDREALVPPHTMSFPAYADYLRGLQAAHQGTRTTLESAIAHYHRALLLDPEFWSAWAALAEAYVLLPASGGPPIMEVLPYAQAALDRAMAPGRESAEAYAASAYLKMVYLWDLPGAETDFRRAVELDATNPIPRTWRAQLLGIQRRWDEALAEVGHALELDPRSPSAHMTRGLILMCAERDGARAALERALELAPDMHPAAYVLGGLLAMQGELEEARQVFDRFSSLTGTDSIVYQAYLAAIVDPSKRPEAVAALQEPAFFGPVQRAELLAHLGEHDASLALLERSVQARSPYLPWVNAMPQYDGMRSDPRFSSILAWVRF